MPTQEYIPYPIPIQYGILIILIGHIWIYLTFFIGGYVGSRKGIPHVFGIPIPGSQWLNKKFNVYFWLDLMILKFQEFGGKLFRIKNKYNKEKTEDSVPNFETQLEEYLSGSSDKGKPNEQQPKKNISNLAVFIISLGSFLGLTTYLISIGN